MPNLDPSKVKDLYFNDKQGVYIPPDPYTLRFRFSNKSFDPREVAWGSGFKGTWKPYMPSKGLWDWTYENSSWADCFWLRLQDQYIGAGNAVKIVGYGDLSGVTSATRMFGDCHNLTQVTNLYFPSCTGMGLMFENCTGLLEIPRFDTSHMTSLLYAFKGCTRLKYVPLLDTSNVTQFGYMFAGCTSLQVVPAFDTSKATSMGNMFDGCTALKSVPAFDTKNVTFISEMFRNCSALESTPLFDTRNVAYMDRMYQGCTVLDSIPTFRYDKKPTMNGTFKNCLNCASGQYNNYVAANAAGVTHHTETFYRCGYNSESGNQELNQIPYSWQYE